MSLNAPVKEWPDPSPANSPRTVPSHHVYDLMPDVVADDYLDSFYLQGSSQWDGFLHMKDPLTGMLYNDSPGSLLGIEAWAERGLAGRGVLLDLPRWAAAGGREWDWRSSITITGSDLEACAAGQGVELTLGTFLLVRVGWEAGYRRLDREQRVALSEQPPVNPGLESSVEMAARLWDWGVAAVGCDNPALEGSGRGRSPSRTASTRCFFRASGCRSPSSSSSMLAEACRAAGTYEFLFTAAPLNVTGGVGSPANALANPLMSAVDAGDRRAFAEFLATTTIDSIPGNALEQAKLLVASTFASAAVGRSTQSVEVLRAIARD